MHLAAQAPDRNAVADFVQELDHGVAEPQQDQVLGGKHAVGKALAQGLPLLGCDGAAREHHGEPGNEPGARWHRRDRVHQAREAAVRIDQRKAQRERIEEILPEFRASHQGAARGKLLQIGAGVGNDEVRAVKAADQRDELLDRRRLLAEPPRGLVTHLGQRADAIEQREHVARRRADPVRAPAGRILDHEPGLPAVHMPVQPGMRPQPHPQLHQPVELPLQRLRPRCHVRATSSRPSGAASW